MTLNSKITDWKNQRVWIIGASTGIGAALAEALHTRGARVAVSARRAEKLQSMVAAWRGAAGLALPLDITKIETIVAAEKTLTSAWGGYDLVVFMAGDYTPMRAWEIDLAVAEKMIETNLTGMYKALSVVVPPMLAARSGGLALVSSVAGYRGLPQSLVYGPTKAALINLAETLYLDLRDKGLNVYVVNPGFVETPLTAQNKFEMPHIITAEVAAVEMIKGFEAGEFEIHFPKRFSRMLKALQYLPMSLYVKTIKQSTKL